MKPLFLLMVCVSFVVSPAIAQLCQSRLYAGQAAVNNRYTVCVVDLRSNSLKLFWRDSAGQAYGSFDRIAADLKTKGQRLLFAMNAGMYHDDLRPVGLYIERGQTLRRLVLSDGPGNFHLKPNGVFYWSGTRAGVMESGAFARTRPEAQYATQSGPMLLLEGRVHPRFQPGGTSLKIRNGVGMVNSSTAVFVRSENPVNFYDFALFFRDALKTRNALYLDGSISSLYDPQGGSNDGLFALGPIVGVVK